MCMDRVASLENQPVLASEENYVSVKCVLFTMDFRNLLLKPLQPENNTSNYWFDTRRMFYQIPVPRPSM
jgi:hypothetical protein